MILWVVALKPEAAPLVAFRGLERVGGTPWPLYRGADDEALVVTGVGRNAAAAACGWVLGHLAPPRHAGWINAGIAGHSEVPVGEALIAQRVVEAASGRAWYPPPLAGLDRGAGGLRPTTLFTVDRAETDFGRPGAYDMEASAFLDAVGRSTTAELAQVVKVVSDGPEEPATRLDRTGVQRLIEDRLDTLAAVAAALARRAGALAARGEDPPGYALLVERHHFTVTQRRQLRRLLERRLALDPPGAGAPPEPAVLDAVDGRSALRHLARQVEELALAGTVERG